MKPLWKDILLAVFYGMVLPWIFLSLCVYFHEKPGETPPEASQTQPESTLPALSCTISLRDGDAVADMALEEYLVGVVLAELPASFEPDAKKAQAVAARTFAWKAHTTGGKHGDGSVCTDSRCCQAYISPGRYSGAEEDISAAREAVYATAGSVLTYGGELIEATYFSCSGGSTEDAVAVWGTDFPYLRATDSPGEENATHYTDTLTYTAGEFQAALGTTLSGSPASWFGLVTYTAGGGVATMKIGGKDYSGTTLRTLLQLRSTAFSIQVDGEKITITTRGYGHRVGMSQYGADAMAVSGRNWQEILQYYYQGVQIDKIENLG